MRTRSQRVAAFLVASASCSTMTMRISRDELEADIASHFPREIDKHAITLRVSEPRIDFPGKPDILGVRLRVDATSPHGHARLGGTARVEGRLEYVAPEHAFYLRDPEVTELALEPALGGRRIEHAVRAAVEDLLQGHPVYRLDASRSPREAKAIRHLRSAHIDGRDLLLEVGL